MQKWITLDHPFLTFKSFLDHLLTISRGVVVGH
jgi:hypothetical protein